MRNNHPYALLETFIMPAWERPEIGRIVLVYIGFELALMITPAIMESFTPDFVASAYAEGTTAFGTILEFAAFGITLAILHRLTTMIHKRGVGTMIGPADVAWADFKAVLKLVVFVLVMVELAPPYFSAADFAQMRGLLGWMVWIPPAVLFVTLQAGTEEIFFRGYLQQQLAVISARPLVWMGMPSVLFGAAHYFNGYGPAEGVLWAVWATLLGLSCADLTARTGSIGAAVGLHTANNLFVSLYIGIESWPATGLALFLLPYEDPTEYDYSLNVLLAPWAGIEIATSALVVLIMWLAARIALRR